MDKYISYENIIARYNSEFIWQDVRLTDEFKLAFANCVSNSGGVIKYHECTAVVTTSKNKDIFVPNQWFVIASYVIELCEELKKYQSYYFKVADQLNEDYEDYAKSKGCTQLRMDTQVINSPARALYKKSPLFATTNDSQFP